VLFELPQVSAAVAAAPSGQRKQGGQPPRMLFEQFDTEEFAATARRTWSVEPGLPRAPPSNLLLTRFCRGSTEAHGSSYTGVSTETDDQDEVFLTDLLS
jgi:hypothetical protein